MSEIDYVTGGKSALSNPMVALLQYLAAKEHGVRYLKGLNVTHQYTFFKECRISTRTWKALETRGLITDAAGTGSMSTLTAEGYRALLQFSVQYDLRQAIVDTDHAGAVIEDLERQVAGIDQRQAEECGCLRNPLGHSRAEHPSSLADEEAAERGVTERMAQADADAAQAQARMYAEKEAELAAEAEAKTERYACQKLATAHGWERMHEDSDEFGDAWIRNGRTLVAIYEVRPEASSPRGALLRGCIGTWTRPVDVRSAEAIMSAWRDDLIKFRSFAEFAEHVTGKTVADAADALLDERATDEIPEWGSDPEHAVQAVWAHKGLTGLDVARDTLTETTRHTVTDEAVDQAVALGWLREERRELPDHNPYGLDVLRSYRVADRVRNLAMLRAAERHRDHSVAVLDSRVLVADEGVVTRLTIGTNAGRWYLVRERVSPTTLDVVHQTNSRCSDKVTAQAELARRVSSLLSWGWSQAFRFTGDGVTPVR